MAQKSKIHIAENNFKDSLGILNRIQEEEKSEAIFLRGIANLFSGNFKEAIKDFEIINNQDVEEYKDVTRFLKGHAMKHIESEEEVLKYFNEVYEIYKVKTLTNSYDVNYKMLRIMALIECKRYEEAETYVEAIGKSNMISEEVVTSLKLSIEERKNNIDKSISMYKELFM